jgi:hypothetical protein
MQYWQRWRKRHPQAFQAARRALRIENNERIVVGILSALAAAAAFWLFESWGAPGRLLASATGFALGFCVFYIWKLIAQPIAPEHVTIGLSDFYRAEHRNNERAIQRAIDSEITTITGKLRGLDAKLASVDATTNVGQWELKRISDQQNSLNDRLTQLRSRPRLQFGFTPGD